MVSKKDGGDEILRKPYGGLPQAFAKTLYQLELVHEIVRELAKHLSVSEEEWEQIVDRAYRNLEKRKDEIVPYYFDEENSK